MHQKWVVPELTNELVGFLIVHAVDSDVEANPKKRKMEMVIQLTITHLFKIWDSSSIVYCHARSENVKDAVEIDNEE